MNNLLIYYLFGKSIIAAEQLPALWGWHFINGTSIKLVFHLVNVMLLFQDLDIIIMCPVQGEMYFLSTRDLNVYSHLWQFVFKAYLLQ